MNNSYKHRSLLLTLVLGLALAACGRTMNESSDGLDQAYADMKADLENPAKATSSYSVEETAANAIRLAYPGTDSVQYQPNSTSRNAIQSGSHTGYYGTVYNWNKGSYTGANGQSVLGGSLTATGPNGGKAKGGVLYIPSYGLVAAGGYCVPASVSGTGKTECGVAIGGIGASGYAGYAYCTTKSGCVNKKNW